jgi:septum formation inhibitor-activating ATPase MinD
MEHKRITLFAGHYGSGKTNIAVNYTLALKKQRDMVMLADLDIVNPYYRAKDSAEALEDRGIRVISSFFANSNVDLPALPQDIYAITDDKRWTCVLDVGGDDRGALALGRLVPAIREENDYEMLLVVNRFRPLTRDAQSVMEVVSEIESACRLPFTGIVNNSNLGAETTAEDVLGSLAYAGEVSRLSGLPIRMTTVEERILPALQGKVPDLFPMKLQKRPTE